MGPTEVTCWHEINCITISVTAILVIRIAVGLRSANHHQQDLLGQDLHCHMIIVIIATIVMGTAVVAISPWFSQASS